jgi:GTP cyclohydrolase II
MAAAQKLIEEAGRGVIIYLDQEGKGNGHLALMLSIPFKEKGMSQSEAYEKAGFAADARRYDPVAQILKELGVKSVALLTDSTKKVANLIDLGVTVSDTRKLEID